MCASEVKKKDVQELSIQWLDFKRTKKYVGWKSEKFIKKSLDALVEKIVTTYNERSEDGNEEFTLHTSVFPLSNGYERKLYSKVAEIKPALHGQINKKIKGKKLPETKSSTDILFFFYRQEPVKEIAAVTSGHAWHVVRPCIHYEFPTRVAGRILDPHQIVEISRRCLFGPNTKETLLHPAEGELYKTATLYFLVESFICKIKDDASIVNVCPSVKGASISVKTGLLRIMKRIELEDYPHLLNLFSLYIQGSPTFNSIGIEEIPDPQFEFLHFLQPAQVSRNHLDTQLRRLCLLEYKSKKEQTISVRHKYLNDFVHSSNFEIQTKSGARFVHLSSQPPTLHEIFDALENESTSPSLSQLQTGQIRYQAKNGAVNTDVIINFFEGEVRYEGRSYFKIRGMWYQVDADYSAFLQDDFRRLLKQTLIHPKEEGQLPKPWKGNERKGHLTQGNVNAVVKLEKGIRLFMAALGKATVCYVDEKNQVCQAKLVGEILKVPIILDNKEIIEKELTSTSQTPLVQRIKDAFGEDAESILEELKKKRPIIREFSKKKFVVNPFPYPLKTQTALKAKGKYEAFTTFLEQLCEESATVEDEETYCRSYLYEQMNKGVPFGPQNGYLVLDQICPRNVEPCDLIYYTNTTTYLYHVKENFGQHTRDACSQILNAAKELRSSLSVHQPEDYLQLLWKIAAIGEFKGWRSSVQKQLKSLTYKNFLNIFYKRKIVFVYAFLEKPGHCFHKEARMHTCLSPNDLKFKDRDAIYQELHNSGYIDSRGRLTGKFLDASQERFNLKGFEKQKLEIYDQLAIFKSVSDSTLAKLELVRLAQELRGLNFEFKICQIERPEGAGSQASQEMTFSSSAIEGIDFDQDEDFMSPVEPIGQTEEGPKGLINIINSCYMNAALQALFQIPSVCELMEQKKDNAVIKPLRQILKQKNVEKSLRMLRAQVFQAKDSPFEPEFIYGQQDAHEFMVYILDQLGWKPFQTYTRFRYSIGNEMSQYSYTRSPTEDPTNHLTLHIGKGGEFETLLNAYFDYELKKEAKSVTLRGKKHACDSYEMAPRIIDFPNFLLVTLKRFDNARNKIDVPVQFPNDGRITLKQDYKSIEYKIVAIINHEGNSMDIGHYTTDFEQDGKWFHCSDSRVKQAKPINPEKNAYIVVLSKTA